MRSTQEDLCIQAQRELQNDPDTINVPVTKAALFLGCSKSTLDHWRVDGKGPEFRMIGKKVFYPLGELRKIANNQLFNNTSQAREFSRKNALAFTLWPLEESAIHLFWVNISTLELSGSVSWSKNLFRNYFLSKTYDVIQLSCRNALIGCWEKIEERDALWAELSSTASLDDLRKLDILKIDMPRKSWNELIQKQLPVD